MKKYMLFLFILLVALLTSCNLDNQGIFAEVLDRVPSDNRRISLIGNIGNDIYFSSKNGIESYNLVSGVYTTIDGSAEAKKSNRFILDGNNLIYFVESANSITPKYDGYYSININTKEKKSLDGSANTDIFCGAFDKYLINKNGDVFSTSVDANNNISFPPKATATAPAYRFVKNIDDILVYTTSASGIPDTSSLVYYYFDDSDSTNPQTLQSIVKPESDLGNLRSVAKDASNTVLTFSKTNEGTSFYKLNSDFSLTKITSISTVYQKDFASFIDNGNLYYAYDGSSSFYKLPLNGGTISSTTISKISTVSIIGYFKVGDNYKICTTNNGFFTLSVSGTPTIL